MVFIFISIVLFAINNVLWKITLQENHPLLIMTLRATITSLIGCILVAVFWTEVLYSIYHYLAPALLAGVLGGIGLLFMLFGLEKGSLKLFGFYSIFGTLLTCTYLYFLEELIIKNYLWGSILIFIGFIFYMLQLEKKDEKNDLKTHLNYFFMILFFSASSIVHWKNLKSGISPIFSITLQEMIVLFIGLFSLLHTRKTIAMKKYLNLKSLFYSVLMAIIIFIALLFSFLGLKITNPYISSILSLIVPLLTILFGALFFKEKMSLSALTALLVISFGAFILKI